MYSNFGGFIVLNVIATHDKQQHEMTMHGLLFTYHSAFTDTRYNGIIRAILLKIACSNTSVELSVLDWKQIRFMFATLWGFQSA